MIDKIVGENIKNARKAKGMRQQQLANRLEISRIAVSNMENGKNKISIYRLYEVCFYLNIELSELIDGCRNSIYEESKW